MNIPESKSSENGVAKNVLGTHYSMKLVYLDIET